MEDKKQTRLKTFSQRYVSAEAAADFDGSVYRRLYTMDDYAEKVRQITISHGHCLLAGTCRLRSLSAC